jgi:predicted metal-dependent phosphoesterase TrpH
MDPILKTHLRREADMEEAGDASRCDLHVHSVHSGPVDLPVLGRFGNECYSEPEAVYEVAKRRGMNLVTLTDHDSIEGALHLAHLADVFVSEEVTCVLPGGRVLHLGVFDITEAQHEAIARRRRDAECLFAYLAEEGIAVSVNHLFSALTGRRALSDFRMALDSVPLVEVRNGMMPSRTNGYAASVARAGRISPVGGSDAHTLATVARAWTVVRGARTREEFLNGLRRGLTIPAGGSGSYARLTADVVRVFSGGYLEAARRCLETPTHAARFAAMVAAIPVLPLIPIVTAGIYLDEVLFAARHYRRFLAAGSLRLKTPAARGPFGQAPAASALG